MFSNVKCDAKPFPSGEPKVEEPVTPPTERRTKKEEYSSESSDSESSDSEFFTKSTFSGKPPANVFKISNANDIHIGSRFNYFSTLNSSTHHHHPETDNDSHDTPGKFEKGPKPCEELLDSKRNIDTDDMYIVAENISAKWKKLARYLPPKNVFSEGQLKTFQDNNPHHQEEVVFEMLSAWKQRCPDQATVGILALTLWDIGKGDIANQLVP